MSRTTHFCISARGLIRHLRSLRKNAKTGLTDDQGRPLSRDQAIEAVIDEIAKGRLTLPMGGCANPCPRARLGCEGFDYAEGGGCPGYQKPEQP